MATKTATFEFDRVSGRSADWGQSTRYVVPLGRLFLSAIFLMAVPVHFSAQTIAYAAQQGVPFPGVAVPLSGLMAGLGGLSIALGYRARLGALLLVLFLVPVTLMMHNFWAPMDPMMAQMQQAMFMKNVGLLGGALLVLHFGAGPISIDSVKAHRVT